MSTSDVEKDIEKTNADIEPTQSVGEGYTEPHGTRVVDGDAALAFLRGSVSGDDEAVDDKRLLRKIDWMIMPLMWSCYFLQYLDKTLINYAAVMGLYDDAHISKSQFSTLALLFYVTYLAFEFPHGYGMQKLPTAKYLGTMVALWGLIVTVTCACQNYGGLVVTRVLLGCFESAVAPSLILITTMWYKKNEAPLRIGFWYLGTGTGTIAGSLISFGFQHYHSETFTSWQIMFLVVGLVTICVGITVCFLLPDNPMSARFLTTPEKRATVLRVKENQTGIENKHVKPKQILECFKDPQTWLIAVIVVSSNIPNGAVSSYQATIIKNFGYTSEATALLQIPSGAVSIVSILSATWMAGSQRFELRIIGMINLLLVGVIGGCLMAFLPEDKKAGKLIGNYMTQCIGASLPLLYSLSGANFAGHTKKVTMNAILLMAFCLGNIIGPLTFISEQAPDYIGAKIAIIVCCGVAALTALVLRFYYVWQNKMREAEGDRHEYQHEQDIEFADKTDKENREFRYRY